MSPVPPLSAVLRRRYDFPSAHLRSLMDSLPQPTRSLLLSCSPQRSCKVGGPFQARALSVPAARLSGFFRLDANGISQVSRRSFPCLCSALRPRSNRCVLAISATSMLPTLCAQRRLRQLLFRGSFTQLRHPLTYASRFVLPLTRKARFRLAGWPLPGGRRTLWTATRGFSSYSRSSSSPVLLTLAQ